MSQGDGSVNVDTLTEPGIYLCAKGRTTGTLPFNFPTIVVIKRVAGESNWTVHQIGLDSDGGGMKSRIVANDGTITAWV